MITKYTDYCLLCGKPKEDRHHLVNGNGSRELADADDLVIPTCRCCHSTIHGNPMAMKLSKICGQLAFEKHWVAKGDTEDEARERFRERYGRSYL